MKTLATTICIGVASIAGYLVGAAGSGFSQKLPSQGEKAENASEFKWPINVGPLFEDTIGECPKFVGVLYAAQRHMSLFIPSPEDLTFSYSVDDRRVVSKIRLGTSTCRYEIRLERHELHGENWVESRLKR